MNCMVTSTLDNTSIVLTSTDQPYNYDNNNSEYAPQSGGFDSSGGSQTKTQTRNTLTPVTIKQIVDSHQPVQDGDFVVNNLELNMVSFVGVVRGLQDQTSNVQITVEDGTGSIEVRKWVDENTEHPTSFLKVSEYVYITGALKEFSGKKNIQYATVRPVHSYNEVIYHYLSAIKSHLYANGQHTEDAAPVGGKLGAGALAGGSSLFVSGPDASEGPKSNVDKIYNFISDKASTMPEGVPVALISQSLGMMQDEVMMHCQRLTEDAKIYHGYDDSTFLAV